MHVISPSRKPRVRRVLLPASGRESFTVIGADARVVDPIDRYLAWITNTELSPNTVRAYAHDLRTFWEWLVLTDTAWDAVTLEQLGRFTAWLRLPEADGVVILRPTKAARTRPTVNRTLSAVFGFYKYHQRNGVDVHASLVDTGRSGRGRYKPMLHGIARQSSRGRLGRLREDRREPKVLTLSQVAAIINCQQRLRNRLLFAAGFELSARVGTLLGSRICDWQVWENRFEVVPRDDNANGMRTKNAQGWVPMSGALSELFGDYMREEFGETDSDYVFVNLWGGVIGEPLRYSAVESIVERTRREVGFHFTFHHLRHTRATLSRKAGLPWDVVSRLLLHESPETTHRTYIHLDAETIRAELARHGVLDDLQGLL